MSPRISLTRYPHLLLKTNIVYKVEIAPSNETSTMPLANFLTRDIWIFIIICTFNIFSGWRNAQGKLNFTSYVVRKGRAFVHHFLITGCLWFGIKILGWKTSLYLPTGNFLYKYNTRRSFIYSDNVLKLVRTQNPKPFLWTLHIFCSVKSISLSCSLWSGCFYACPF